MSASATPRISVIQPGARLHYAMPRIFAEAGILGQLHTDLHAEHGWLRAIESLCPRQYQPRSLRRLLGRRLPPGLPASKVHDRPIETLLRMLPPFRSDPLDPLPPLTRHLLEDLEASDLGAGDLVYTVLINEDRETLLRMKDRGIKIVHECIIGPDVGLLLAEEEARFPGLEPPIDLDQVRAGRALDEAKYLLADLILVPSTFTAAAVEEVNRGRSRVANVPYGFDLAALPEPAAPEPGRVLFVGTVGLRKGNPDLAAATRLIQAKRSDIEVRVVGPANAAMAEAPVMRGPNYIGQVPRSQVFEEYARADVFVLPTICDSFGIVLLEAMALGVPVIATPNCGDVVRDGIDGFVVPPREPAILAERIQQIVGDRALRETMSRNARERVADFSYAAYRDRLLAAIMSV